MGKKLTIEREKTLAGSGIEFFIVLNLSDGEFLQNVGRKENYFGAILLIWQIRNNMFHGSKYHPWLDNQIELFKAMNELLQEVHLWRR